MYKFLSKDKYGRKLIIFHDKELHARFIVSRFIHVVFSS